jgi:hypothetical protein
VSRKKAAKKKAAKKAPRGRRKAPAVFREDLALRGDGGELAQRDGHVAVWLTPREVWLLNEACLDLEDECEDDDERDEDDLDLAAVGARLTKLLAELDLDDDELDDEDEACPACGEELDDEGECEACDGFEDGDD